MAELACSCRTVGGFRSPQVSDECFRHEAKRLMAIDCIPKGLPYTRNTDGRPVWEPPMIDYSELIDEAYERQREAVLKYTRGDVVRTTSIMDVQTESNVLLKYQTYARQQVNTATGVDIEAEDFFSGLWKEITRDWDETVK